MQLRAELLAHIFNVSIYFFSIYFFFVCLTSYICFFLVRVQQTGTLRRYCLGTTRCYFLYEQIEYLNMFIINLIYRYSFKRERKESVLLLNRSAMHLCHLWCSGCPWAALIDSIKYLFCVAIEN